jgi:GDP-L-fucose synthase
MYGLPRKVLWGLCKTYGDVCGLNSAHLILPNLYGPGDHFDPVRSHALGALVKRIVDARDLAEPRVSVWGTGKPIREWMYAEDAAAAVVRFLRAAGDGQAVWTHHPIYNIGVGIGVSIADLAELIRAAAAYSGELLFDYTKPDGAMTKLLDGARFAALTGWSPRVTLHDGIARTVAWYQTHGVREPVHAH